MSGASALQLERVRKIYGSVTAVEDLDLTVEAGSLVALLGPSGCGKTTTLRVVAGFEMADAGRITIGGQDMTRLPPNRRNLGMVFQHYSLFPHRTVAENIAFGLRMAGKGRAEQAEAVERMLGLVQLEGRGDMYPRQLSGGQQQRVALARSLVVNPRLLLLDEPLGALDKALRESMQFEIREMQQRLAITTLLVTHDQEEAMTMSDRIAVMHGGRILQIGAPGEIYDRPKTRFVAEFLGTSNIFDGRVDASGRRLAADGADVALPVDLPPGERACLSIRPERVRLGEAADGLPTRLKARVSSAVFRGTYAAYHLRLEGSDRQLYVYRQADGSLGQVSYEVGTDVWLGWRAEDSVVVEAD